MNLNFQCTKCKMKLNNSFSCPSCSRPYHNSEGFFDFTDDHSPFIYTQDKKLSEKDLTNLLEKINYE